MWVGPLQPFFPHTHHVHSGGPEPVVSWGLCPSDTEDMGEGGRRKMEEKGQ